ncbi:cAMP-regulated phosphoprotein 21-like [Tripterygium wilfordii]|uniref:cAMP-regulated phosphoprotein 21-like n=1 Tax=Tripterygium wilfordii TaxID=458696 RepID=UPI0018F808FD|nr:cAMP-regulated phosphoprotein 21-like [Tripterygium wilfordii]
MESTAAAYPAPVNEKESMVDPFLVEALQNPRHRLTILRMELDIQRFLQSSDQYQFEFQHFPTSYLRLAAHRVAQHYGLLTIVQDNALDGSGNKILVRKTAESRYPTVCLSEVPAKLSDGDKRENVKIVIRPRPNKGFVNEGSENGIKRGPPRSVEERKEEYDRARARIFSGPSSPESDDSSSQVTIVTKSTCLSRDENEGFRNSLIDPEKVGGIRDGGSSSRVAIFRDREKERTDPDYDRSYERYVRSLPTNQTFSLAPFNVQEIQFPFWQYGTGYQQLCQMRTPAPLGYGPPASPAINPFSATGLDQTSGDPAYIQLPSATMMYAHSYEPLRQTVFQAPFCQQPLSFDYSQNY